MFKKQTNKQIKTTNNYTRIYIEPWFRYIKLQFLSCSVYDRLFRYCFTQYRQYLNHITAEYVKLIKLIILSFLFCKTSLINLLVFIFYFRCSFNFSHRDTTLIDYMYLKMTYLQTYDYKISPTQKESIIVLLFASYRLFLAKTKHDFEAIWS